MTLALNEPTADISENAPEIGQRMEDGTIFAGISPETHQPFYALAEDAALALHWRQAMDYAALAAQRLPTKLELNVLFQHRAQIGGFKGRGLPQRNYYWSSTRAPEAPGFVWAQEFDEGSRDWRHEAAYASVRLVRD